MILCAPVKAKCYATLWSYGEICVGCGCCSSNPEIRRAARLAYWEWWLKDRLEFTCWASHPELLQIQKENIATEIKLAKRRIRYYQKKGG